MEDVSTRRYRDIASGLLKTRRGIASAASAASSAASAPRRLVGAVAARGRRELSALGRALDGPGARQPFCPKSISYVSLVHSIGGAEAQPLPFVGFNTDPPSPEDLDEAIVRGGQLVGAFGDNLLRFPGPIGVATDGDAPVVAPDDLGKYVTLSLYIVHEPSGAATGPGQAALAARLRALHAEGLPLVPAIASIRRSELGGCDGRPRFALLFVGNDGDVVANMRVGGKTVVVAFEPPNVSISVIHGDGVETALLAVQEYNLVPWTQDALLPRLDEYARAILAANRAYHEALRSTTREGAAAAAAAAASAADAAAKAKTEAAEAALPERLVPWKRLAPPAGMEACEASMWKAEAMRRMNTRLLPLTDVPSNLVAACPTDADFFTTFYAYVQLLTTINTPGFQPLRKFIDEKVAFATPEDRTALSMELAETLSEADTGAQKSLIDEHILAAQMSDNLGELKVWASLGAKLIQGFNLEDGSIDAAARAYAGSSDAPTLADSTLAELTSDTSVGGAASASLASAGASTAPPPTGASTAPPAPPPIAIGVPTPGMASSPLGKAVRPAAGKAVRPAAVAPPGPAPPPAAVPPPGPATPAVAVASADEPLDADADDMDNVHVLTQQDLAAAPGDVRFWVATDMVGDMGMTTTLGSTIEVCARNLPAGQPLIVGTGLPYFQDTEQSIISAAVAKLDGRPGLVMWDTYRVQVHDDFATLQQGDSEPLTVAWTGMPQRAGPDAYQRLQYYFELPATQATMDSLQSGTPQIRTPPLGASERATIESALELRLEMDKYVVELPDTLPESRDTAAREQLQADVEAAMNVFMFSWPCLTLKVSANPTTELLFLTPTSVYLKNDTFPYLHQVTVECPTPT